MVDRSGCDELMLDENCRRHRSLIQDVKTDANQVLAIALGKEGHRPNELSLGLTQFRSSFGRCILPHDGAVLFPARFLKGTEGSECTWIINSPYEHVLGV